MGTIQLIKSTHDNRNNRITVVGQRSHHDTLMLPTFPALSACLSAYVFFEFWLLHNLWSDPVVKQEKVILFISYLPSLWFIWFYFYLFMDFASVCLAYFVNCLKISTEYSDSWGGGGGSYCYQNLRCHNLSRHNCSSVVNLFLAFFKIPVVAYKEQQQQ